MSFHINSKGSSALCPFRPEPHLSRTLSLAPFLTCLPYVCYSFLKGPGKGR